MSVISGQDALGYVLHKQVFSSKIRHDSNDSRQQQIRSGSECDPIEFSFMNSLLKAMDVFTSLGSEHMPSPSDVVDREVA